DQRIPLRRVLRMQDHEIVVEYVGSIRFQLVDSAVRVHQVAPQIRSVNWREPIRVELVSAGKIQRKTEGESSRIVYLSQTFANFAFRQKIDPAEDIIRT